MEQLSNLIAKLTDISGRVFGWLVPIIAGLILIAVFMRYRVGQPLIFAEEYAGYMLVAIAFLGMAYTWREGGHVRVTALVSRLPAKVSNWLRLITMVLAFAFTIALIHSSYNFLARSFKVGMVSSTYYRTPLQGPHMTIMIGFILLALLLIFEIARVIMNIRAGKTTEEKVE